MEPMGHAGQVARADPDDDTQGSNVIDFGDFGRYRTARIAASRNAHKEKNENNRQNEEKNADVDWGRPAARVLTDRAVAHRARMLRHLEATRTRGA